MPIVGPYPLLLFGRIVTSFEGAVDYTITWQSSLQDSMIHERYRRALRRQRMVSSIVLPPNTSREEICSLWEDIDFGGRAKKLPTDEKALRRFRSMFVEPYPLVSHLRHLADEGRRRATQQVAVPGDRRPDAESRSGASP
jgi:hypothetical protein